MIKAGIYNEVDFKLSHERKQIYLTVKAIGLSIVVICRMINKCNQYSLNTTYIKCNT